MRSLSDPSKGVPGTSAEALSSPHEGCPAGVSIVASLLERLYSWSHPPDRASGIHEQVSIVNRSDLARSKVWQTAFSHLRKDRRYYEIVEDTICPEFRYRYFAIKDGQGQLCAIQPFFVLDQDFVAGAGARAKALVSGVRRFWPRFMMTRALMVGCAAGEAHLQAESAGARGRDAELLSKDIVRLARQEKVSLVVLKEFPAQYRDALSSFLQRGFTRIPSMPMTRLNIAYSSFEDYMTRALKSATRKKLRKNLSATEHSPPITLEVVSDAASAINELYPLYLQVFDRSKLQFEKLSKSYFRELGRRMPDKTRFFLWRQNGKLIAFALCLIEGDTLCSEYVGFDYTVALDLHLYHYVVRDIIGWGIENGFKFFASTALNYAPKLQMRHVLEALDLYVRHTSPVANAVMKRVLPWFEPTRSDPMLRKFPNYGDLWG